MRLDTQKQALRRALHDIGNKQDSLAYILRRYIKSETAFIELTEPVLPGNEQNKIQESIMDAVLILRLLEE